MFVDIGADWNHVLAVVAVGTAVLSGLLLALCAAAGICARPEDVPDRKCRPMPRNSV